MSLVCAKGLCCPQRFWLTLCPLLINSILFRKQKRFKTKEDLKQEEDDLLRKIIEEKMDIRGGYQKPEIYDVLWMQLLLLPYSIYKYEYLFYYHNFHYFKIYTNNKRFRTKQQVSCSGRSLSIPFI